jgi:hypothetical protein
LAIVVVVLVVVVAVVFADGGGDFGVSVPASASQHMRCHTSYATAWHRCLCVESSKLLPPLTGWV